MAEITITNPTYTDKKVITYSNGENAYFLTDNLLSSCPNNSSAVGFWCYDLRQKSLTVQYKKSPTYYIYEEVPMGVVFDLMLADSLGQFIAKVVKPNYSVA